MGLLTDEQRQVIDGIEQAMIKSPLELRTGLGMNRQQYKQMQREINKYQEALSKLTPVQAKAMSMFIEQKAKEYKSQYKVFDEQFQTVLDRCISAMLIQLLPDNSLDDIQKIEEHLGRMMAEDTHKQQEYFVGEKEKIMELSKRLTEEVEMFIIGRLEAKDLGVRQKVLERFPQLSAAMMENACKKTFENWKKAKGATMMDREQGKVLVKEMLETGTTPKEIKNELKFEFPTMSNKDVEKLYKEGKKEYDQEHLKDVEVGAEEILNILEDTPKKSKKKAKPKVTMTKEAGEQLEEIVEELKADGKVIDSLGIKISDETSEAMAKVSEELRDVDKRFVEGWGKNAPSVELVEVPEEAQKELAEIEEERYMPTEKQVLSITEQLKGKVELLSAKEQAIEKDIDKCQEEIAKLQLAIEEKRNSIGEVKRKKEVAERMIKDAEILEAI